MDARPWTETEMQTVASMTAAGATIRETAAAIGREYFPVYHRLQNIKRGIAPRKWWTDERQATLKHLWESGQTIGQVAAALGTTRGSVAGRLDRMGLFRNPDRTRPPRPPRKKKVCKPWSERKHRYQNRKAKVIEMAPEPAALNLTFQQLEKNDCRYVVTADHPTLFCGHPKADGSSYCAHHHHVCWVPPHARNREARPR